MLIINTDIRHQTDAVGKHEVANSRREQVLDLYANSDYSLEQIAAPHGISQSTISLWAKQAGLPRRQRGRFVLKFPTKDQQQALRWLETHSYQQVASKLGVSKAYIGHLAKRWRNWIVENNLRIGHTNRNTGKPKQARKPCDPKVFVLSFRLTATQLDQLRNGCDHAYRSEHPSLHCFARAILMRALADQSYVDAQQSTQHFSQP